MDFTEVFSNLRTLLNPRISILDQNDERGPAREFVAEGDRFKEITNHPFSGKMIELQSLDSFIQHTLDWGDPIVSIIKVDQNTLTISMTGDYVFGFKNPDSRLIMTQTDAFRGLLGGNDISQSRVIKLLEQFPDNFKQPQAKDLELKFRNLEFQSTIDYKASIKATGPSDDIKIMFSNEAGQQSTVLPRKLHLCLPFYVGFMEMDIEVRLQMIKPSSDGEQPRFQIVWERRQADLELYFGLIMAELKKKLTQFKIYVAG